MFDKVASIKVSERVFDYVREDLENLMHCDENVKLSGYLETFNNCREQGYYLVVSSNNKPEKGNLIFWAYEHRSSDNIMVVESTKYPYPNGLFEDEDWKKKWEFSYRVESMAAEHIVKRIKEYFEIV